MRTKFGRTIRRVAAFTAIVLIVAACGTTVTPSVSAVAIDGGDQTLGVGASVTLTASVTASGGASEDVTWSTSDAGIVSVDAGTGEITGVAAGSAEVTATSVGDGSVSDTITVTVEADAVVSDVTIDNGDQTMTLWDEIPLSATVTASGGASEDVTWSSSDDASVSVDATGLITANAADVTVTITATSVADPSVSGSIEVTVEALPAPTPSEIFVDGSVPAGGNGNVDFPFQAVTEGIAAVDAGGIVRVAAGTYEEELHITKPLQLLGAGVADVTLLADANAPGPASGSAIDIENAPGVTLSGFTLDVVAPGPSLAAIGALYDFGSSNLLIENVAINHTNAAASTHGVGLRDSSNVTLRNVDIVATTGGDQHSGAGVYVTGQSSGIELDGVETTGHESFAGLVLSPGSPTDAISNVVITATTFNEVNKLTFGGPSGDDITGLDAPMFVAAVGNPAPVYGSGSRFFYKTGVDRAIEDALWNFNEEDSLNGDLPAWIRSTVQLLDPVDQAVRTDFVLGSAPGDRYGFTGATRSLFVQAAVDAAEPNATIELQAATYAGSAPSTPDPFAPTVDGATVVDVAGLTIQGAGAGSVLSAAIGPVLTIDADDVTISGVEIDADPGVDGIVMGTGDNLTVSASNLLTDVAIDNTADADVLAENNWWGAVDGPSGIGPGSGSEIVDATPAAGGIVDYDPFATVPF